MRLLIVLGLALGTSAISCGNEATSPGIDCRADAATQTEFPDPLARRVTKKEIVPPSVPPPPSRPLDLSVAAEAIDSMTSAREAEIDGLLTGATVLEISDLLQNGQLTSIELATYYRRRIERYDKGQLNSVLEIDPTVLSQAENSDRERLAGDKNKPLLGIPVLLKDNIAAGPDTHTTAGAVALSHWRPMRDATLVTNLRRAGAIVLGKTNMSEWANFMDDSMPSGFSTVGGQTVNPYGFPTPFGSSSGSAVAAAANLATITIGTETQGAIIAPAGINAVVGLKPSRGLVSRDLVVPLYEPQDTAGPMGRNVTDVAVTRTAIAGNDTRDPRSAEACAVFGTDFTEFFKANADVRVSVTVLDDRMINSQLDEAKQSGLDADTIETIRANLIAERGRAESVASALESSGATVVRVTEALEPEVGDLLEVLPSGFRREIDNFLTLNPDIGLESLEEIVLFNDSSPTTRAPYGHGQLISALTSSATSRELASATEELEMNARKAVDTMLESTTYRSM